MKRLTLSLAILFWGISVVLAQVIQTSKGTPSLHKGISKTTVEASTKVLAEELVHAAKCTTLFHKPSLENSKNVKGAPRKSRSNGVLMGRPEGSFYNRGTLESGGSFTSILVPQQYPIKFPNYCDDPSSAVWILNDEVVEGNYNNELEYITPTFSSFDSMVSAPSIMIGNDKDQLVDFLQPGDIMKHKFNYLNTIKTGYYYFSNGSPFMTEDIAFDMDGDGTAEDYKCAGIRQFITEKPMQPLVLDDIYIPFYSKKETPLKDGQTLKCIIRYITIDDADSCILGSKIAEMEVTAEDLKEVGAFGDNLYEFYAVFANYEEDDSGTKTAVPVVIDDMFAVDILGFDNEDTDIQLYGAFLHQDENEFYTKRTRATRIVLNNTDGTEYTGGTLAYYNSDVSEPYGYCAIMFFEGIMNGVDFINNEENGIFYSLNQRNKTAEVINNPNYYSGNIDIPNTVAFDGVDYIVTAISHLAFSGCVDLTSVTIPSSITSIGDHAFYGCSSLTSVIIPNSVTSIGGYAFRGCSGLNTITIGSNVTSIGESAYAFIPYLTDVYCYAESIPETNSNAFINSSINTATLHVPAASLETYKNTLPWSGFGNIVAIEPPQKCSTPTISFTNGRLQFGCETEGVEFVPSISLIDAEMESNDKVDLFSVYRFNVYAKKEGYADSDMATMDIDFNRLNGDMNNDGQISIADATAIVNIILNDITVIDPEQKFYYSVGTEKVTRTNYTTINNAQYKLEFSEIPETLDLSAISQQQAVILLPEGCMPMIRGASGLVGTTSVSLGNGYMVYTTTSAINGSECTCTVYK